MRWRRPEPPGEPRRDRTDPDLADDGGDGDAPGPWRSSVTSSPDDTAGAASWPPPTVPEPPADEPRADEPPAHEPFAHEPPAHGPPADEPATPTDLEPTPADAAAAPMWEPRPVPVRRPSSRIPPGDLEHALRRTVSRALAEDLGEAGDITTRATVPAVADGEAAVVARQDGTVAGTAAIAAVYAQVDPRVAVALDVADGDRVAAGQVIATIHGPLRSILTGERTALNLLGHLSGVATRTRAFVDAVAGTSCQIRDTRKTTPGLRLLEKAAVAAGGGVNHRRGLDDQILVKDNHVAAAGSLTAAVHAALDAAGGRAVQIEVRDLDELDEALAAGALDVLLDNLAPDEVRAAVAAVQGRARLEASGRVDLDTVRAFAEAGVDSVAVGAITHSAPNLDVALDVRSRSAVTGFGTSAAPTFRTWELGGAAAGGSDRDPASPAPASDDDGAAGLFAWRDQLGEEPPSGTPPE